MKKTSAILLIGLFIFMPALMTGQNVTVNSYLDTNKILIGDQIHYHIQLRKDKDLTVRYFGLQNLPKQIEILNESELDTSVLNDKEFLIKKKYLLTVFDTGSFTIPSLKFKYGSQNQTDSIFTDSTILTVQPVRVDTTDNIFTVKSPFGAPVTLKEALPYIAIGVGAILLILLVIYLVRKFKRKEEVVEPEKPSEPAHVIAFRELDKLKNDQLWQSGKIKLYYTRLTEILRKYLWLRYDIKTLERTTDEILTSLKNTGFDQNELYKELEDTLHLADLVKFAKFEPDKKDHEESMERAYRFVKETRKHDDEKEKSQQKQTEKAYAENGEKTDKEAQK
jgi:hypothetical protein